MGFGGFSVLVVVGMVVGDILVGILSNFHHGFLLHVLVLPLLEGAVVWVAGLSVFSSVSFFS